MTTASELERQQDAEANYFAICLLMPRALVVSELDKLLSIDPMHGGRRGRAEAVSKVRCRPGGNDDAPGRTWEAAHTMSEAIHPLDYEGRALWHLELLGCYAPEDAVAPWEPEPVHWYDDTDDGWDDEEACTRCGGEGFAEVDDPLWDECDEFGWGPCNACHGTGERRHQWVF